MADLTPITRLEGILAGQDIQPITRLEYFLKQYAGGGDSGGGSPLIVNATASGDSLVCDKTAAEMFAALQNGGVMVFFSAVGSDSYCLVSMATHNSAANTYLFDVSEGGGHTVSFVADGDDAYPSFTA